MKTETYLLRFSFFVLMISLLSNAILLSQNKQVKTGQEFGLEKATNLGEPINTTACEYAPTISADGNTLIFESDREQSYEWRLYITHKTESGWSEPLRMDNVNSSGWDGGPFLTYDQNYLIISSDRDGGLGHNDIWISKRLGEKWTTPENMGAPINSSGYDAFASLSNDGKTLYFMRYAEDNAKCEKTHHYDLYFSQKKDGEWSEPQKLPFPINSEYCESHPIILADAKTLIFSSIRPGGLGGYDLYKSEKQDDGSWSDPENLGSFINTTKDDRLVSIPASGDIMYFTSGEDESDDDDLYSVPIPVEARATTVITVTGTVADTKIKKPLTAEITIFDVETAKDTTVIQSNEVDGKYIVILNKGKIYDVSVSSEGYTFRSTQFDLRELEDYQEYTHDILLEPLETGSKFILNNIFFDVDSDVLLDVSKFELSRVIKLMRENSSMIVEISGHTDSTASEAYNIDLSKRRAKRVVNYLIDNGINNKRLSAKGYGESQPIAANSTEEGRSKNRRVEFRIQYMEDSAEKK